MQLTRAVDYGIRALMLMSDQPVGARYFLQDLAERGDLPRNYLVKVLKSLSCAGIVRSHRGIKGGFSLGRDPRDITLRQIVETIDGPVNVMHCINDTRSCTRTGKCGPEVYFRELRSVILKSLEKSTLQDLINLQSDAEQGAHCAACVASAPVAVARKA